MARKGKLTAKVGQRTDKGTLITDATVAQQAAIDAHLVVVADHTDEVARNLEASIARALEAVGLQAEGDAKDICPVDTGRLRNSITHTIDNDGKRAIIGTNTEYAEAVHNNRRHPQPFLTDAVTQNMDTYRDIFKRYASK